MSQASNWVDDIAKRASVDAKRIQNVLAKHRITAAPVLPSPRRLTLIHISFSGVKDRVERDGPFAFEWSGLGHGLWAMLSDKNLRGKSSILEVVHWLLRGRTTSNLQEDVRRWIHKAELRFLLDGIEHRVSLDARGEVRGTLSRSDRKDSVSLARFEDDAEFETVMSDFFMRAFSMDAITSWSAAPKLDDEAGKAVSHGWAAFSGAMFIGTNYDTLLGDLPVTTGLIGRLIQMYIGAPWVPTFASAQSALKGEQSAAEARVRRSARDVESKQQRRSELVAQLDSKKLELESIPSDAQTRMRIGRLNVDYADATRKERLVEKRLSNEAQALEQARLLHNADRKDLQTHLESMAAGAIFRQLDPTFCPRCDVAISEAKKKLEQKTHACSVCGEQTETDEDASALRDELEGRVSASKKAFEQAEKAITATQKAHAEIRAGSARIQVEIDEETARLGSFDRQQELGREIAVLEGRIAEAGHTVAIGGSEGAPEEIKLLQSIVDATDSRVREVRDDLLKEVSGRIVHYAQLFGMHSLSEATLKANANLALVKGGTPTSYSKVTPGEKLRLKVATVLAMLEVGESRGVGRHPGLLMIDSPGAQEVSQKDLEALVSGLQSISANIPHCQVFVAGRSSDAITQYVPEANRREAHDGGFLW